MESLANSAATAQELAIAFRRDDYARAGRSDLVAQVIGVIAFVGNRSCTPDALRL